MTDEVGRSAYDIDPELAEFAELMSSMPLLTDVQEARSLILDFVGPLNAGVDVSGLDIDDRTIPGPPDAPDVTVRVYRPRAVPAPVPAVLKIHGGGFVTGSIDTEHGTDVELSRELGIIVVSVNYRLAPEHPFPAGLDDCYAALVWLHGEAEALGVDPTRIAVKGGSAGGGLAAAVALLTRDRGGPPICFQYLSAPELDDRLETASMHQFIDTPVWNRPSAEQSWAWYLGNTPQGQVSHYAAPARADSLAGLPPAYIATMQFDPMRDEGILYALRLLQAGVSVELHSSPGTFHGSQVIADAAVTQRENTEMMVVLRRALDLG